LSSKSEYWEKAGFLANKFKENFKKFEVLANDEIKSGALK